MTNGGEPSRWRAVKARALDSTSTLLLHNAIVSCCAVTRVLTGGGVCVVRTWV